MDSCHHTAPPARLAAMALASIVKAERAETGDVPVWTADILDCCKLDARSREHYRDGLCLLLHQSCRVARKGNDHIRPRVHKLSSGGTDPVDFTSSQTNFDL
jgi:hypothetical protein